MMRDSEAGGVSPWAAGLLVGGAMLASGLVSRRYSPDPTHPRIRRWYKALDKPGYTPPDAVFGAAWPVLLSGLGYGAYRLLRAPGGRARDMSVGLAAATLGLVTAYTKITFGDRNLSGGVIESGVLVATAAAYVASAARVDGIAAAAAVPLALWSSFGGVLTQGLVERNPELDAGQRD